MNRSMVFVTGAGHSGSTLVSLLLDSAPGVFSVGEMHAPSFVWRETGRKMCSCGLAMADCAFFESLSRRLRADGIPFDPETWDLQVHPYGRPVVDRLVAGSFRNTAAERVRDAVVWRLPGVRRRLARIAEANRRFVHHALDLTDSHVFVDANKEPIRISFLERVSDLPTRYVHLVRDPRAYANSRMRDKAVSAERAARDWWRTNSNVVRLLADVEPERRFLLRYEDLCRAPDASLAALGEFLRVGPISVPEELGGRDSHVMGNKMRLSGDRRTRIRYDDAWRRRVTPDQVRAVQRVAGPLARSLGYDVD